jgi:hypothetical protein
LRTVAFPILARATPEQREGLVRDLLARLGGSGGARPLYDTRLGPARH